MKKITKKGPMYLKGLEFNIPLFNADTQMYLCTDVSEVGGSSIGKDYNISLSEVKQNYSVPERVDIHLFIPTTDANGECVHITMNEIRSIGDYKLANRITDKSNITTLGGLKKVFYEMAKRM